MAGISLGGFADPFASVGGSVGGSSVGSLLSAPSAVLSSAIPGAGWLQTGMQVLSAMASPDQSGAAGATQGDLNTSGWVVGKGDAKGGSLSSSKPFDMPWYGWAAVTLVAVALIKGGR